MEKINPVVFSYFRNNDHVQFMTDFNTLVSNATPVALNIEAVYPEFNEAYMELDQAFKVDGGSLLTAPIVGADNNRDQFWSALGMRIRATLIGPIEAEVTAAEKIKRVYDLYGNVRQLSQTEESAALNSLVDDLENEEYAPLCSTIGITAWVAALKEQNALVQSLIQQRRQEDAHKASGDVKAAREAIEPVYEKIVSRINALIELEMDTPEINEFVTLLNKQIKDFETLLASRAGHRPSEEDGNGPVAPQ